MGKAGYIQLHGPTRTLSFGVVTKKGMRFCHHTQRLVRTIKPSRQTRLTTRRVMNWGLEKVQRIPTLVNSPFDV